MPFLVSFGAEHLILDRDIERARAWSNRSVCLLDGDGLSDAELISICETSTEQPQTVIVDDAQKVKGDKLLRAYIRDKVATDLSVVLVAIVRTEKLPDVWAIEASKAKTFERKKLKTWESNNEVVKWISSEAERLKVYFDKGVDQMLYQNVGPDLYLLANEIRKLAILVGPMGKIEKKHLQLVVSPSPVSDPFQVAEAVISKDPKKAMNLFSILFKNEGDDSLIPVVNALMKQVEKTLVIRHLLDRGVSEEEIPSRLEMKPWIFKNFALPIAKRHDAKTLIRHMGRLCKLDVDVKGPARSKRTLVELAIIAIS